MIEFPFVVGHSFRDYAHHPITVKTNCNQRLESEGLGPGPATLIAPTGECYRAQIYRGVSSWCEYFQIRVLSGPWHDPLAQLPLATQLIVTIDRNGSDLVVRLSLVEGLCSAA